MLQRPNTISLLAMAGLLLGLWTAPATAQSSGEQVSVCPAPEARQFDFWIGEWDINNRHRNPQTPDDPTWFDTGAATNRVYAILDGCAIVEHWMGRLVFATIHGFSVRAYDPAKEQWVLVLHWPSSTGGSFSMLEGVFRHGRGEFFSAFTNAQGQHVDNRFSFSDIIPTSFRWDSATSTDGRLSWTPGWIMEFTRRDALMDRPLFNGPALDNAWCTTPEARAFDFFAGDWTGTSDGATVTVQVYPILNGCALMDFVEAEGSPRPYKRFRVRAYDATLGQWVQYAIDNRELVFERAAGSFEDGTATLTTQADAGSSLFRETWSPLSTDTILWKRESSTDGGASWTVVSQIEFTKLP